MAFPATYNFSYYKGDTNEFVIRPLRWKNASVFQLEEEYDYISYHWYNRSNNNAYTLKFIKMVHII